MYSIYAEGMYGTLLSEIDLSSADAPEASYTMSVTNSSSDPVSIEIDGPEADLSVSVVKNGSTVGTYAVSAQTGVWRKTVSVTGAFSVVLTATSAPYYLKSVNAVVSVYRLQPAETVTTDLSTLPGGTSTYTMSANNTTTGNVILEVKNTSAALSLQVKKGSTTVGTYAVPAQSGTWRQNVAVTGSFAVTITATEDPYVLHNIGGTVTAYAIQEVDPYTLDLSSAEAPEASYTLSVSSHSSDSITLEVKNTTGPLQAKVMQNGSAVRTYTVPSQSGSGTWTQDFTITGAFNVVFTATASPYSIKHVGGAVTVYEVAGSVETVYSHDFVNIESGIRSLSLPSKVLGKTVAILTNSTNEVSMYVYVRKTTSGGEYIVDPFNIPSGAQSNTLYLKSDESYDPSRITLGLQILTTPTTISIAVLLDNTSKTALTEADLTTLPSPKSSATLSCTNTNASEPVTLSVSNTTDALTVAVKQNGSTVQTYSVASQSGSNTWSTSLSISGAFDVVASTVNAPNIIKYVGGTIAVQVAAQEVTLASTNLSDQPEAQYSETLTSTNSIYGNVTLNVSGTSKSLIVKVKKGTSTKNTYTVAAQSGTWTRSVSVTGDFSVEVSSATHPLSLVGGTVSVKPGPNAVFIKSFDLGTLPAAQDSITESFTNPTSYPVLLEVGDIADDISLVVKKDGETVGEYTIEPQLESWKARLDVAGTFSITATAVNDPKIIKNIGGTVSIYYTHKQSMCIYDDSDPSDDLRVIEPKLTLEDNASGSLTMKLPPTNIGYNQLERLTTDIVVEKDGEVFWKGRILSEKKDFWNDRDLYCEGELAFLNDTHQPPHRYHNQTIRQFLNAVLTNHNSKVDENRRIYCGAVTVTENVSEDRLTNYETTLDVIQSQLVGKLGGHLRIRNGDPDANEYADRRYLDYLIENDPLLETTTQTIDFGENLLDFVRSWDPESFATVLIPLGKRLESNSSDGLERYVTAPNTYVESEDVGVYGWIEKVVEFENVASSSLLVTLARQYMRDHKFDDMVIEVKACDLHYLDETIEDIRLLDYVRVISEPHGLSVDLSKTFLVAKLEIPLDKPENTEFTLGGAVKSSFTKSTSQITEEVLKRTGALPSSISVLQEARDNAASIIRQATEGYITITQQEDEYRKRSEALVISNHSDLEDMIANPQDGYAYWQWNSGGLGYFRYDGTSSLWRTITAITMDGAIVADAITTGTMTIQNGLSIQTPNIGTSGSPKHLFSVSADGVEINDADLTISKTSGNVVNTISLDPDNGIRITKKVGTASTEDVLSLDSNGNIHYTGTLRGPVENSNGEVLFDADGVATTGTGKGVLNVGNGNFIVDAQGNVTLKGNITWGSGNKPTVEVKALYYASIAQGLQPSEPTSAYSYYNNSGAAGVWHKVQAMDDTWVSFNYSNGEAGQWQTPVSISEASEQSIDRDDIVNALRDEMEAEAYGDGIYRYTSSGTTYIGVNATYIRTGMIDVYGQGVTIGVGEDGVGGGGSLGMAFGSDGINPTAGLAMKGPKDYNYVYASDAGVCLKAGSGTGNYLYVTSSAIGASRSINQGSDRRIKKDIDYDFGSYEAFFDSLKPAIFKMKDESDTQYHFGFIAQDVADSFTADERSADDYAVVGHYSGHIPGEEKPTSLYSLAYNEFVSLNTYMIQKLQKRVEALERMVSANDSE